MKKRKEVYALIPARSGSKGIINKNVMNLRDYPLLAYSILAAKKCSSIDRVVVSTDSEEYAEIALKYGAEVPFMRPNELAQDDSPEWLVWKHALDYLNNHNNGIDGLVVVPTTAPLRSKDDVNNCINEFEKGNVDVVITVSNAHRSPYFNMVKTNQNGFSSLVISSKEKITRRQEVPEVFDMTTVAYVAKPGFVLQNHGIFDGRVRCVHIPPERSLDIDTPLDFKIAECLVNNK